MLAMSDTSIEQFLPIFANSGVNISFLVPTLTGFEKFILLICFIISIDILLAYDT